MFTHINRSSLKTVSILLVVAALLFGGIGITGVAAQSSLPGDTLYPVKTGFEETRLTLTHDAKSRAELQLNFAEQRLEEIGKLVNEGRLNEVDQVVLAFEAAINSAIMEAESLASVDPSVSAELSREITSALTEYTQKLVSLLSKTPDDVKSEVERALETTRLVSGLEETLSKDDSIDENNHDGSVDDSPDDASIEDSSKSGVDDSQDESLDDCSVNSSQDSISDGSSSQSSCVEDSESFNDQSSDSSAQNDTYEYSQSHDSYDDSTVTGSDSYDDSPDLNSESYDTSHDISSLVWATLG